MVQFQVLSGKKSGTCWVTRRFPVRIGRLHNCHLQLEDPGVWDNHLELTLDRKEGFQLVAGRGAVVTVNREPVTSARLRNGDEVEIGAVRMRFSLAETRLRGLRLREAFVWMLILSVSLGQVALVYLLLR